jgi:hypothetical protein
MKERTKHMKKRVNSNEGRFFDYIKHRQDEENRNRQKTEQNEIKKKMIIRQCNVGHFSPKNSDIICSFSHQYLRCKYL